MKILFINSPVIRSVQHPSPDFKFERAFFHPIKSKLPFYRDFLRLMGYKTDFRYGVRAGSRWPFTASEPMDYAPFPFFMAYAAAYLAKNGHEVSILDSIVEKDFSYDSFFTKVKNYKPELVFIECSTPTIDIDLWVAKTISKFSEIAIAGPHLLNKAQEVYDQTNSYIKYFLQGEYILNSLKIVEGKKPGIYPPQIVKDLDSIPFSYRDFNMSTGYYDPSMPTTKPQLQIYSSKGCPFKCSFCMWPHTMYQGQVSLRKPKYIISEIKECISKDNYKSIFFDDDTFNLGTERISALCDGLKEIGIPWTMMGRLDCSPDWLYDKMVDSGCVGMRFGVETFDIETLKRVSKGLERIDFKNTLAYISNKYPNLMIHLTMMQELPGQTEEIHQNDLKILQDLGYSTDNPKRSYQMAVCVPFPGTRMYEEINQGNNKDELKNYKSYDGAGDASQSVIKNLNK